MIRLPAWNGLEDRWGIQFPVWGPLGLWRLARLARDADIVHVHDAYHASSLVAAIAAKRHRRPLFATQHAGTVQHDQRAVNRVQRLVYSSVGRLPWRWAEEITVYTPITAGFLRSHGVAAEQDQADLERHRYQAILPRGPGGRARHPPPVRPAARNPGHPLRRRWWPGRASGS